MQSPLSEVFTEMSSIGSARGAHTPLSGKGRRKGLMVFVDSNEGGLTRPRSPSPDSPPQSPLSRFTLGMAVCMLDELLPTTCAAQVVERPLLLSPPSQLKRT